jgi:ubiquitin thioesterase protein OTUB1
VIDDFQQVNLQLNFIIKLMLEKLDLFPNKLSQEEVKKIFCDKMQSDYLIMYMRMMTSGFIKTNSFMFEGYIETETVD